MTDQFTHLQEQVDTLFLTMSALRQETLRLAPTHDRMPAQPSATVSPSPPSSVPSVYKPEMRSPSAAAIVPRADEHRLHRRRGQEHRSQHGIQRRARDAR